MARLVYLWHWAPRCKRASIRKHGLRMMSWRGTHLVLFAATLRTAWKWRQHIRDRHDELAPLDGWLFCVSSKSCGQRPNGIVTVFTDIPPGNIIGPIGSPMPRESAISLFRDLNQEEYCNGR